MTDRLDDSNLSLPDDAPAAAIQAPDISPNIAIGANDPTFQAPALGIDAPDISPNISISADDPTFRAPSIMGGVDFSGNDLPMRGSGQAVPWTVQSGGVTPAIPSLGGGGSQPAPDRAKGISTALGAAGTIVDGTHGAIGQIGQIVAKGDLVLKGLKGVTTAITTPLTIGSGVANTISQIRHGAPPDAAIMGNAARTGLVLGIGGLAGALSGPAALGIAPLAAYGADRFLPDGTSIGKAILEYKDTQPPDVWFD